MLENSSQSVRRGLSIQVKFVLFLAVFFLLLIVVSMVQYLRVDRSISKSNQLIVESTQIFGEIDKLAELSRRSQEIFDEILVFDSVSDEELFTLQARFNAVDLEFDILLNVFTLGAVSEEFAQVNHGLDVYLWEYMGIATEGITFDRLIHGDRDRELYDRVRANYDDFVTNVRDVIAVQRAYLRTSQKIAAHKLEGSEKSDIAETEGVSIVIGPSDDDSQESFSVISLSTDREAELLNAQELLRSAQVFGQKASLARTAIDTELTTARDEVRDGLLGDIITQAQAQKEFYQRGVETLISIIFFLVVFASFIVHFLAIRPLRKIAQSAEQIIGGERDVEIPLQDRHDEVGFLARSFSGMVDALVQQTETLEVQVKARTKQLDTKNSELELYIAEIQNVTKNLMRRDIELTRANERLKEADEAKNQFVSVAAHQLRTPLTAIRWIYESLSHAKDIPETHMSVINNGMTATENLIATVNDMLNVARIDEGRMRFVFKEDNLTKLLGGILTEFTFDAKHKGLHFESVLPPEDVIFSFDWEKLDMVIRNLLSNALKYTEVGGIVRLGILHEKESLTMIFADNGIGIPKHQQSRIFSKFFRADNALKHQTNGSGLGLYVTRDIVEKHGGTIILESHEGEGTTFTVKLPLTHHEDENPSATPGR